MAAANVPALERNGRLAQGSCSYAVLAMIATRSGPERALKTVRTQ
jgi:hypothetical protein